MLCDCFAGVHSPHDHAPERHQVLWSEEGGGCTVPLPGVRQRW